jgi:hypothetical protein
MAPNKGGGGAEATRHISYSASPKSKSRSQKREDDRVQPRREEAGQLLSLASGELFPSRSQEPVLRALAGTPYF